MTQLYAKGAANTNNSSAPTTSGENNITAANNKEVVNKQIDTTPYIVTKKVHIGRIEDIKVVSYYVQVNSSVTEDFDKGKRHIGNSVNAKRLMFTTSDELYHYLPGIIGIRADSDEFTQRATRWYENISREVPSGIGLDFDISFKYNAKDGKTAQQIAEDFENRINKIQAEFDSKVKDNPAKRSEYDKVRNLAIHNIEATKYQYGNPINVVDYIHWRHCLLYGSCAKDLELAKSNANVIFYLRDDAREKVKAESAFNTKIEARKKYISIYDDRAALESIAYIHASDGSVNITSDSINEYRMLVDSIVEANPKRFLQYVGDKDLLVKSTIERLIAKGYLTRLAGSQNIKDADGILIGDNLKEAVEWFNNNDNVDKVNNYKKLLTL